MACDRNCSFGWDVRCCCEPNCPKKNTTTQFNNCPKKLDTLHFHLLNDYRTLEKMELMDNLDVRGLKQLVRMIHRGIKLSNEECYDLLEMIEDDRDDGNTYYND